MSSYSGFRVLITDLSTRKSFDLANILNSKGIKTLLCDDLGRVERVALEKAYGAQILRLRKNSMFSKDLAAILMQYPHEKIVYIPIEEDTTLHVYEISKHGAFTNLYHLLPPQWAFDTVRDKGAFADFCEREGLPVPKTYHFADLIGVHRLPDKLILKPRSGSGSIGIRFIDTPEELNACRRLPLDDYLLQQRLENARDVEGAFFLFHKGELVSYYGHKRIRTYPKEGGVSIYSKCELKPELKALGSRLLEKLAWSGIAMVEFLYDENSKSYKIIEVNPRLWGSLMLSEFCGANMIENYSLGAIGKAPKSGSIDEQRYIRWLFPWDIIHYLQSRGRVAGFWRFEREKTCYINFSYAPKSRALLFTLYNLFSPAKLKKLYRKVFRR